MSTATIALQPNPHTGEVLMRAQALTKRYLQRRGLARGSHVIQALDGVDFTLASGTVFGLVGESGSGKSTLARCLAGLETPTSGQLCFNGVDLLGLSGAAMRDARRHVQLIFQDAATALNPSFTAAEIIAEPLVIQKQGTQREQRERALQLMNEVGLAPDMAERWPHQFSGGQRQRLSIARALTLRPKLLILDEALSGLDLSTQAHILDLLLGLRAKHDLTYVFISHDLRLVSALADEIAVMHRGKIVERGKTRDVLRAPHDAHTRALVAAMLPPLAPEARP